MILNIVKVTLFRFTNVHPLPRHETGITRTELCRLPQQVLNDGGIDCYHCRNQVLPYSLGNSLPSSRHLFAIYILLLSVTHMKQHVSLCENNYFRRHPLTSISPHYPAFICCR